MIVRLKKGVESMINTHKKLIEKVLEERLSKEELYKRLVLEGYKGDIEDLIPDLLYATVESDAYMYSSQKVDDYKEYLTEEEYFQILINDMNLNY